MSTEKIIHSEKKDLTSLLTPKEDEKISSGRVDINDLIARVRLEKQRENKSNIIFLSLIFCLVVIVGTILSF
ncbi:hypothetical protein OAV82_02385 [Candidatus Pelagibacter sp.]|nr:hypothetical protein [Candidatus Pelagibacter sp.]